MNLSAYLEIVAHAHPFMTTVYQYSHGCFQQDYVLCYKFLNLTVSSLYSNGLRCQEISVQQSAIKPLGFDGTLHGTREASWTCS